MQRRRQNAFSQLSHSVDITVFDDPAIELFQECSVEGVVEKGFRLGGECFPIEQVQKLILRAN